MDFQILLSNLTNPTLLFFGLGIVAAIVRSDLEIPRSSSRFIALYLLFAIGFKGGQELVHEQFSMEIVWSIVFGLVMSALVPLYTFFMLRKRLDVSNAGAVAASYGSVSAVTFVAAVTFLEAQGHHFDGHMVAVMALMESPAIIVGVMLLRFYSEEKPGSGRKKGGIIHHSLTNGSVLMILGSLLIGVISDAEQAEGIKPFTNDIFKGFLAIFLLEMGMVTAKRYGAFRKYGGFLTVFGLLIPAINGCFAAWFTGFITESDGNRLIFAILAASASYIAVPAAMRIAAPKADPGLYIPMALGVTFPFNITVGMPLYFLVVQAT